MNEKLIEMAKTAGFVQEGTAIVAPSVEQLERFVKLIREDERHSQWQPIESDPFELRLVHTPVHWPLHEKPKEQS